MILLKSLAKCEDNSIWHNKHTSYVHNFFLKSILYLLLKNCVDPDQLAYYDPHIF